MTSGFQERLLLLAERLRGNGVPVSTGEVVDASRALRALVPERQQWHQALQATLIKDPADVRLFDELFLLTFSAVEPSVDDPGARLRRLGVNDDVAEQAADLLDRWLSSGQLPELAQRFLGGGWGDSERMLRLAALSADLSSESAPHLAAQDARALLREAGGDLPEALSGLERFLAEELGEESARAIADALRQELEQLLRLARHVVDNEVERRREQPHRPLAERSLKRVSQAELRRLEQVVQEMAVRLLRVVKERKRRRRGRLDMRRTMRRSLRTGGVPFELSRWKKARRRPSMVVVCDVSDSMAAASRLMLLLIHSLHEAFRQVRSYVFVQDLVATTELFARSSPGVVLNRIFNNEVVNRFTSTDYGRMLAALESEVLVTDQTTLLILGDGRNNDRPANLAALRALRARVRELVWITPEPRSRWRAGDSEMALYASYCHQVEVGRTLQDLESLVRRRL